MAPGDEKEILDDELALREILIQLFQSQKLAVLATVENDRPYTNLVAFASTTDLKHILFATTRATRKFSNISANRRVAMLVDNRSNEVADIRTAYAVTIIGEAQEALGQQRDEILPTYLDKLPHMKEFVTSPTCALLRISVETYFVVSRFQNVTVLNLKQ